MRFNQEASIKSLSIMMIIVAVIGVVSYIMLFPPLPSELFNESDTVFVIPIMTANAYRDGGFYDYYKQKCGKECLSIEIDHNTMLKFSSSKRAIEILSALHYDSITDYEIAKNPSILKKYDKVILMHSEYVTREMFDVITSHPKMIYLFPNSLYAEVTLDGETMTLIKGHGYPDISVENGFDWKYDNTHPYEFDDKCETWKFNFIENGYQLNCYPDMVIKKKLDLLKALKEL